jgi:riboflavin kinase/FMN adenylyltransferase
MDFSVLSCAELPQFAHGGAVSSTQIRHALEEGDMERANGMLGYEYGLYGVVVSGNRLGRTIGFPTANMQLYEPLKLVPRNGVYDVEVEVLGHIYKGMCNIGVRPTVDGKVRTIETHILAFDEDIYGLPLRLRFLRRIRDERKFPSLDALRAQLEKDKSCVQI